VRSHRRFVLLTAAVVCPFSLVPAGESRGDMMYQVIALGDRYFTEKLNNSGQVVGSGPTANDQGTYAFRYNSYGPSAGQVDNVGGTFSGASGINDAGVVVGQKGEAGTPLARPADWGGTGAAISNSGQVVVPRYMLPGPYSEKPQVQIVQGGSSTPLPVLADAHESYPEANNGAGQVVGSTALWSTDHARPDYQHATLWSDGQVHDLGTLGGKSSYAYGINDAGAIVGSSGTDIDTYQEKAVSGGLIISETTHAFLNSNNKMPDLGTLGGTNSYGSAINNRGDVVGTSDVANGEIHAFLYHDGTMVDLNRLIPQGLGITLNDAKDINDLGQILAWSYDDNGRHDYLLTPGDRPAAAEFITPAPVVPEPTTLATLVLGWGALALRRHLATTRSRHRPRPAGRPGTAARGQTIG
jgi:probable HAF family extracellular repeat protein